MVEPLWIHTPLLFSQRISNSLESDVFLKLENLQPSQSFKYRGMSLIAQESKKKLSDAHLFIASGGNAGLAAACAAKSVGVQCTIFLPAGLNVRFLERLKDTGATILVGGKDYSEALAKCREAVTKDSKSVMVSAYDDVVLWRGHASMVEEMATDLKIKPDAILCSVGGAGLLTGVMLGCKMVGWDDVPVVALETNGADCFYHSMQANSRPIVKPPSGATLFHDNEHDVALARLSAITSRASSLGASSPAAGAVSMALHRKGGVRCVRVPDILSMQAALSFTEDHKFLVELACSTTLVPAYNRDLFDRIIPPRQDGRRRVAIFVVCGGAKISLNEMEEYRVIVDSESGPWKVWYDGKEIEVKNREISG